MTFFNSRVLRFFLVFMISSSAILLVWQRYGMELALTIVENGVSEYDIFPIDDGANGGTTKSSLVYARDRLELICDIYPDNNTYSYCELAIKIAENENTVDLSKYDAINVELGYTDSPNTKVRLQIKNKNPYYASVNDRTSEKFNVIEYNPTAEGKRLSIPLNHFVVPEWWISQYHIPIVFSQPEFDRSTMIQVSVSSNIAPGRYELWVKDVTLTGKLISYTRLVTGIMVSWIFLAIVILIASLLHYHQAYNLKNDQLKELNAINKALNLYSKKMAEQAKTDPLTGSLNRNGVTESLLAFQTSVRDQGADFSIIFCDIDNFKSVNDDYGHLVGDEVLVGVAKHLHEHTRFEDIVVRWGGEEFVLFCPQTSLTAAEKMAEKLRSTIEKTSWPEGLEITASFGIAQMQSSEDIEQFLCRADQALYKAKGQGRNRVEASAA